MKMDIWMVILLCHIGIPAVVMSQTDALHALCTATTFLSDVPVNQTTGDSTQETVSVFVGSTVDVCGVAPNSCTCTVVTVDDVHDFPCDDVYTVNGLLVARYSLSPMAIRDHKVSFLFLCNGKHTSSSMVIPVQDVKISNITVIQGCDGVDIKWESPPATSYQIRVGCEGSWYFTGNISDNSTFLSLEDYFGLGNCTVFVSAITAAGLGPVEVKPFAFYSDPVDSIVGQELWIEQMEYNASIVYNWTMVALFCASKFPIWIITHAAEISYYNVVNVSATFSPHGTVVGTIPKHLPKTKIMVIASNPEGCISIIKNYNTYETLNITFNQTNVPGLVELGCLFAVGSTGNGCLIEIEGRENVSITRHGLEGTKKYKILQAGEYVFTVFDWPWDVVVYGPVLTRNFTVVEWPMEETLSSSTSQPASTDVSSPTPTTDCDLKRIVGIIGGVSAGPLGILLAFPCVLYAFWRLYKLDGKKARCREMMQKIVQWIKCKRGQENGQNNHQEPNQHQGQT